MLIYLLTCHVTVSLMTCKMEEARRDSMASLCSAMSALSAMSAMSSMSEASSYCESDPGSVISSDSPEEKKKRNYQYYDRRIISSLGRMNTATFRTMFRVTPGKALLKLKHPITGNLRLS